MKNHEMIIDQAEFTACLKAFIGVLHPTDRLAPKHTLHEIKFCEKIAELNLSPGKPGEFLNKSGDFLSEIKYNCCYESASYIHPIPGH
ncbi:MAG: hypothetical protein GY754_06250 [bacterium]|nr:hypothetical protein [bacterium]